MNEHNEQKQLTDAEMREHLGRLIEESPSRAERRFTPDYSITEEYLKLTDIDTSNMTAKEAEEHTSKLISLKRNGTFTDEMRQAEIDNSLAIPLSESIKLRDKYSAEVKRLEKEIDNYDVTTFNRKATELEHEYKQRAKGKSGQALATLQADYDRAYDALKFEEYDKPRNDLKIKRHEALSKQSVYESRVKLYVSCNKEAIARQIEVARDAEIQENLWALAGYIEQEA